ncbi:MAG: hypothetical protein COU81_02420 [Candidatus Portnoybacteria bacterium CG10_big_fil_rev_8_21_14_0_10_36_7]|uniref:Uncharacterized protein n=1 Tax=Candidatus Portnoybacteria bacterium CG10_big_fil_rev_8_21_14_0_10_36_7 TaxID=1974812 RepID=A0A2M8KE01_9BACT|nr:MAG: hypothetical protein COU81_02420 [Candidatus Portnoybacteria bacterium CG10_big_fil_rev_8_21_14_0_10_36_7]
MKTIISKLKQIGDARCLKSDWAIFGYYFLISAILTFPQIIHISSFMPSYGDSWQFLWNFWWVKEAVIHLHTNPFVSNYIFWPTGDSLLFHTLSLANSIPAIFFAVFFWLDSHI